MKTEAVIPAVSSCMFQWKLLNLLPFSPLHSNSTTIIPNIPQFLVSSSSGLKGPGTMLVGRSISPSFSFLPFSRSQSGIGRSRILGTLNIAVYVCDGARGIGREYGEGRRQVPLGVWRTSEVTLTGAGPRQTRGACTRTRCWRARREGRARAIDGAMLCCYVLVVL